MHFGVQERAEDGAVGVGETSAAAAAAEYQVGRLTRAVQGR
jgi:hypothetical protein